MEKIILKATKREELGKQNQRLRQEGVVPAVVYGHGAAATPIKLESRQIEKVFAKAGTNKIIAIEVEGQQSKNALFHDVAKHPRTGAIQHADFYLVRMDEKVKTEVPIHFTGESTAVYQDGGTLVTNLETIEVEALPAELPENFEVDISGLDDFEKSIHVRDLKVPAGVELLTEDEELICKVDPPRSDEELAELEAEMAEGAPEQELPEGVEEEQEAVREENEGDKDFQPKPSEGSPIT
jgi:large subunit ribosomal protein L25